MIGTRTLQTGVFVVLLFLLPMPCQVARAQEVPCDNSQSESVIPMNEKGKPVMPQEIQNDAELIEKLKDARLKQEDIRRCLERGEPLKNHVIDFDWYAEAWNEMGNPGRALLIADSVMWSFNGQKQISLTAFARGAEEDDGKITRAVTAYVQWKNVTLGPSFSTGKIIFGLGASFQGARFGDYASFQGTRFRYNVYFQGARFGIGASFDSATFVGMASFDGSRFVDMASFDGARFVDYAFFTGANFGFNASFTGATFGYYVSFAGATFGPDALFTGARFGGNYAYFRDATFGLGASFQGARFDNDALFTGARFGNDAAFSGAEFGIGASFRGATFGDDASFFDDQFGGATFGDNAGFRGATFGDNAGFPGTEFGGDVSFEDARFGNDASFRGAAFGNEASFQAAAFGDNAGFPGTEFGGDVSFESARFGNNASFFHDKSGGATFGNDASFRGATFGNDASFQAVTFTGDMSLRRVTVPGELCLAGTKWEGRADFREMEIGDLSWDSEDRPSSVRGIFDAREAKFEKAIIRDVHFSDLVDFSDAKIGKSAKNWSAEDTPIIDPCPRDSGEARSEQSPPRTEAVTFENVIFEKEVDFLRAKFKSNAIFVRNRFRDVLDLRGATFEENTHLCLSYNPISRLVMERKHLGHEPSWLNYLVSPPSLQQSRIRGVVGDGQYSCDDWNKSHKENQSGNENERLSEVYKTIASSFRRANDRLGENEAWYLGMVADRESQYYEMERLVSGIAVRRWTALIFLDFPSRYGIDLGRVVLVSVFLMLAFTIIYVCHFRLQIVFKNRISLKNWHINITHPRINLKRREEIARLKTSPDHQRGFRFRPVEAFFENSNKSERPLRPLNDALFLSGRAFLKLGMGTTYPRNRALVVFAYIEWLVGAYMLIHLLVAVKNTLPIALLFLAGQG